MPVQGSFLCSPGAGDSIGSQISVVARKRMSVLEEAFEVKQKNAAKLKPRNLASRRKIVEEAKRLAFTGENQLLGAGRRRISMGTGDLRRMSNIMYDKIPSVPAFAHLVEEVMDASRPIEMIEEMPTPSKAVQRWRLVKERMDTLQTSLSFEHQTRSDVLLLTDGGNPPSTANPRLQLGPKKSVSTCIKIHTQGGSGLTRANKKFVSKRNKGRFKPSMSKQEEEGEKPKGKSLSSPLRNLLRRRKRADRLPKLKAAAAVEPKWTCERTRVLYSYSAVYSYCTHALYYPIVYCTPIVYCRSYTRSTL
jgi:hypothetical protein